jgi:hypothetical protein
MALYHETPLMVEGDSKGDNHFSQVGEVISISPSYPLFFSEDVESGMYQPVLSPCLLDQIAVSSKLDVSQLIVCLPEKPW